MRKFFIGILTVAFIIISVPTLLLYGVNKTFLNSEFIQGPASDGAYNLAITAIAQKIHDKDALIKDHYETQNIETALKNQISPEKFRNIFIDFNSQFEKIKQSPKNILSINLIELKSDINKTVDDLALQIYQKIPTCKLNELPEVNNQNIPTCTPYNTNFKAISASTSKQFEKTVDSTLPDKFQIDFTQNTNIINIINKINEIKLYFLLCLLFILAAIVVLVSKPFSAIVSILSWLFIFSGLASFLTIFIIQKTPTFLSDKMLNSSEYLGANGKDKLIEYLNTLCSLLSNEIQRMGLVFILIGAIFKILNSYFKKTEKHSYHEDEDNE